jgi:hypothetical protein
VARGGGDHGGHGVVSVHEVVVAAAHQAPRSAGIRTPPQAKPPQRPHPDALALVDEGVLVGHQVGHVDGERRAVQALSRQGSPAARPRRGRAP